MIRKTCPTTALKTGPGRFMFTVSTPTPDREGDVLDVAGWDLSAFRKNPAILWGHRYDEPPIGRAKAIEVSGSRLRAEVEFVPREIDYPLAHRVADLVERGFLNATSVGFRPLESEPLARGGMHYKRMELLEISVVTVPANPEALMERGADGAGVKKWFNGGMDMRNDRVLLVRDEDDKLTVDKQILKEAFREVVGAELRRQLEPAFGMARAMREGAQVNAELNAIYRQRAESAKRQDAVFEALREVQASRSLSCRALTIGGGAVVLGESVPLECNVLITDR